MEIHIRTHSGDKPFQCDYCSYRTARKWSLNLHLKTHTGSKPFKCPNCMYRASRKDVLKVHMKTHPQLKGEIIVVQEGEPEAGEWEWRGPWRTLYLYLPTTLVIMSLLNIFNMTQCCILKSNQSLSQYWFITNDADIDQYWPRVVFL